MPLNGTVTKGGGVKDGIAAEGGSRSGECTRGARRAAAGEPPAVWCADTCDMAVATATPPPCMNVDDEAGRGPLPGAGSGSPKASGDGEDLE